MRRKAPIPAPIPVVTGPAPEPAADGVRIMSTLPPGQRLHLGDGRRLVAGAKATVTPELAEALIAMGCAKHV
jgi:hypothetical protein